MLTCKMDLKARAAVANTAARKPIKWNEGSVPAQQGRGHAAAMICKFDRFGPPSSGHMLLLHCDMGVFKPRAVSAHITQQHHLLPAPRQRQLG